MQIPHIKSLLKSELARIYQASQTKVESFTLPPYSDPLSLIPADKSEAKDELKEILNKYNIVPRELYDVLVKFDFNPKSITKEERALRKKYLLLAKKIFNENVKPKPIAEIPQDADPEDKLIYENQQNLINWVNYVIDIFVGDIDKIDNPFTCPPAPACPKAPECPKNNNMIFVGIIAVLIIMIIIILVVKK